MKKNIKKVLVVSLIVILSLIIVMVFIFINFKNKKLLKKELNNNNLNKVMLTKDTNSIDKVPNLSLKNISIKIGETYKIEDFIENCSTDSNDECILNYSDENMSKYTDKGNYKIEISASDKDGNEIKKETELTIEEETSNEKNNVINNDNENVTINSNDKNNDNSNNKIENNSTNNNKNNTSSNNQQAVKPNAEIKKETCADKIKPNQNPSNSSNFIKFETEEKNLKTTYKYGMKTERTLHITYAIYSDVGKCKYTEETYENTDKSTYNATTDDLKPEAINILNSNLNTIKEVGIKTLNSYRKEVNKADLVYDYDLSLAATIRAMEMYWSGKTSHTRPNGSSCFTIYTEMGITYMAAGENIAWGYADLGGAMVGWKNSPGHYANMISDNYKNVGIGYYNNNYVTLFK